MTEKEAILSLQQGNINAIDLLINMYEKKVFNTILNIVQNSSDAEEITQDVFVKLIKNISSFKEQSAFSTWLYRIAVNESLGNLRKKKAKKRWHWISAVFIGNDSEAEEPPDFTHPGVLIEQKETMQGVYKAIAALPERQKAAFILRYIEHLKQDEIAKILDCKEGAVESLLHRAKQTLQTSIKSKT